MRKNLAILLVATVLIAGCVDNQNPQEIKISAGKIGLVIKEFSVQADAVRSGSSTQAILTLENKGSNPVRAGKGLALLILPTDWTLDKDKNQNFTNDIRPANPSTGQEADQKIYRWRITAPSLSRGQVRSDDIILRTYYDYNTDSNGLVYVYPIGETVKEKSSFQTDRAPIDIKVSVSPDPPIIEKDLEEFGLTITVTNVDEGRIFKAGKVTSSAYSIQETDFNKLDLSISGNSSFGSNVAEFEANDSLKLKDPSCLTDIELIGGKATVICDVIVKTKPSAKTPFPITVTANYGYYIEAKSAIKTTGK